MHQRSTAAHGRTEHVLVILPGFLATRCRAKRVRFLSLAGPETHPPCELEGLVLTWRIWSVDYLSSGTANSRARNRAQGAVLGGRKRLTLLGVDVRGDFGACFDLDVLRSCPGHVHVLPGHYLVAVSAT